MRLPRARCRALRSTRSAARRAAYNAEKFRMMAAADGSDAVELAAQVSGLQRTIAHLETENGALRERNAELLARLARMARASSSASSTLPPSLAATPTSGARTPAAAVAAAAAAASTASAPASSPAAVAQQHDAKRRRASDGESGAAQTTPAWLTPSSSAFDAWTSAVATRLRAMLQQAEAPAAVEAAPAEAPAEAAAPAVAAAAAVADAPASLPAAPAAPKTKAKATSKRTASQQEDPAPAAGAVSAAAAAAAPPAAAANQEETLPVNTAAPVICFSGLPAATRTRLSKVVNKLGGELLASDDFSPRVTHLVCGDLMRTFKVSAAAITHSWILVGARWLEECQRRGEFVDCTEFDARRYEETPFRGKTLFVTPAFAQAMPTDAENARRLMRLGDGELSDDAANADLVLAASTELPHDGWLSFGEFLGLIPVSADCRKADALPPRSARRAIEPEAGLATTPVASRTSAGRPAAGSATSSPSSRASTSRRLRRRSGSANEG